jgi:hypothetical protein
MMLGNFRLMRPLSGALVGRPAAYARHKAEAPAMNITTR